MKTSASRVRALLLAGALLSLTALVARWTAADRSAALRGGATLTDLLTALAGLAVLAALGWLVLLTILLALEGLAGRPLTGWAGCPAGVRRLLLLICGLATASALAVPADAATGTDAGPTPSPSASTSTSASSGQNRGTSALLDGLPMPDRPTGTAPRGLAPPTPNAGSPWKRPAATTPSRAVRVAEATARPAPAQHHAVQRRTPARAATADQPAPPGELHTVRPGDTLWDLAVRRVGPGADASATTRAWRLIYAANRDVIGTDPDLIQPGTTLRVPPTVQEDRP